MEERRKRKGDEEQEKRESTGARRRGVEGDRTVERTERAQSVECRVS